MPAGLVFIWWVLRQELLRHVVFRFRRSARLGPLRFHFAKGGLSSISVGGQGASFNIPVNRSGSPRSTVGLPGTGLSWGVEHTSNHPNLNTAVPAAGLPNSNRLRVSHPPSHISIDGLAVTTHCSAPSSPLVEKAVGMERRQLCWQRGQQTADERRGNLLGRGL